MDFCGRFIVASALTEPVIVGHIRASIRVPQCLELAQRRPMMYPRTPAQPSSPHSHLDCGVAGLGWALDCMILLFYGFNSEMFATCVLRLVSYGLYLTASKYLINGFNALYFKNVEGHCRGMNHDPDFH